MGDRHGGRFARRGRTLSPPRPQVDAHRGVNFRWRATVFRCRGVVGRICPRAGTLPSAKVSRHGAKAKRFAPREKALLGEGIPTRRSSERFVPRRNTPHGESLPTRREGERICPAQEHAPQRRHPDTARSRRDLPRVRTLPTAKASRHGARAKGFAPRRNAPLGEGLPTRREGEGICPREKALLGESLPTRRTSERICPAQEHAPRRKLPGTAHEQKDLCRGGTLSSAKASRHGARAKRFAPRGSPSPHMPTNGGPSSVDGQPEKHPFGGVAPTACGRCRVHSPKKNKTTP